MFDGASGPPDAVVNTYPESTQTSPRRSRSCSCMRRRRVSAQVHEVGAVSGAATGFLEGLVDADRPGVEVDVGPAQSEDLAHPQAEAHGECNDRVQVCFTGCLDQRDGLVAVEVTGARAGITVAATQRRY